MTRMDLPSRSPPPKKAMLSACVRSRVCTFRKAPSKKYSCSTKALQDAFHPAPGLANASQSGYLFRRVLEFQMHAA